VEVDLVGAVGVAKAGVIARVTTVGASVATISIRQKEEQVRPTLEIATPRGVAGIRARVGHCSGEAPQNNHSRYPLILPHMLPSVRFMEPIDPF